VGLNDRPAGDEESSTLTPPSEQEPLAAMDAWFAALTYEFAVGASNVTVTTCDVRRTSTELVSEGPKLVLPRTRYDLVSACPAGSEDVKFNHEALSTILKVRSEQLRSLDVSATLAASTHVEPSSRLISSPVKRASQTPSTSKVPPVFEISLVVLVFPAN
jgi:hypothetical protein